MDKQQRVACTVCGEALDYGSAIVDPIDGTARCYAPCQPTVPLTIKPEVGKSYYVKILDATELAVVKVDSKTRCTVVLSFQRLQAFDPTTGATYGEASIKRYEIIDINWIEEIEEVEDEDK